MFILRNIAIRIMNDEFSFTKMVNTIVVGNNGFKVTNSYEII
jgi:hypothetical protein